MGHCWEPGFRSVYVFVLCRSDFWGYSTNIRRSRWFDMVVDRYVVRVPCDWYISGSKSLFDLFLRFPAAPMFGWPPPRLPKPCLSLLIDSSLVSGTFTYSFNFAPTLASPVDVYVIALCIECCSTHRELHFSYIKPVLIRLSWCSVSFAKMSVGIGIRGIVPKLRFFYIW